MEEYKGIFLESAEDWVCNAYSVAIAYLALKKGSEIILWKATIVLNPVSLEPEYDFEIDTSSFLAGQYQLASQNKKLLKKIIQNAIEGKVKVHGKNIQLDTTEALRFYSEGMPKDRWFSILHLDISEHKSWQPSGIDFKTIDIQLRNNAIPFDGLEDLIGWLGLSDPRSSHESPSIGVKILPPVDLIIEKSSIKKDTLQLMFHAIPSFDIKRVHVGVRAFPGKGLTTRLQVAENIIWSKAKEGIRVGMAEINLANADSALTMLMIGESNVRRQWFVDATKARNNRYTAFHNFDNNLKMLTNSLLENTSADHFEKGVAALLFLMGFSPAIPIETDAPDIIVTTPLGELILVECTIRISDFHAKLGKLVHRKNKLIESIEDSTKVHGVLICATPRNQIVVRDDELRVHKILLATKEDLKLCLDRIRNTENPDKLLQDAISKLEFEAINSSGHS